MLTCKPSSEVIHNLPIIRPWAMGEGGGLIFECFDILLESTPTLHVVYTHH